MLVRAYLFFTTFALLLSPVLGREHWMERNNRAVRLGARRFGQENPPEIQQIANACGGGVCATLAGQAISTLLAANPECGQQDFADSIIDASRGRDATEAAAMVAAAVAFRQAEKNSPPDFTTNPPTLRNTVFCQKAPANPELNGLVQRQDPANGPDFFFDPATKATVKLGAQANTRPFAGGASAALNDTGGKGAAVVTATAVVDATTTTCFTTTTLTVTVKATATAAAVISAPASISAAGTNLQTFTGNLGGVTPPPVTQAGDKFQVEGNSLFNALQNALVRSCDVQHNQCANAANASGNKGVLTVDACGAQQNDCNAAVGA